MLRAEKPSAWHPLYASPQPREWQELSESDVQNYVRDILELGTGFVTPIQATVDHLCAALRAKNEVKV